MQMTKVIAHEQGWDNTQMRFPGEVFEMPEDHVKLALAEPGGTWYTRVEPAKD